MYIYFTKQIDYHVTWELPKICCNISIPSLKNIAVLIENLDLNVFQFNIWVIFFDFFLWGGGGQFSVHFQSNIIYVVGVYCAPNCIQMVARLPIKQNVWVLNSIRSDIFPFILYFVRYQL